MVCPVLGVSLSRHGVDQHASAGDPDRDLVVARDVFADVLLRRHLCRDERGSICMGRAELDQHL